MVISQNEECQDPIEHITFSSMIELVLHKKTYQCGISNTPNTLKHHDVEEYYKPI